MDSSTRKRPQDCKDSESHLNSNDSKRQCSNRIEKTHDSTYTNGLDLGFRNVNHDISNRDDQVEIDPHNTLTTFGKSASQMEISNSKPSSHQEHHPNDNDHSENGQESPYIVEVIRERKATTDAAAEKLELILEDVKHATQKLLHEIDSYLKSVESVTIDFIKCKESQENNARRLDDVETDVVGATGQFTNTVGVRALIP